MLAFATRGRPSHADLCNCQLLPSAGQGRSRLQGTLVLLSSTLEVDRAAAKI